MPTTDTLIALLVVLVIVAVLLIVGAVFVCLTHMWNKHPYVHRRAR